MRRMISSISSTSIDVTMAQQPTSMMLALLTGSPRQLRHRSIPQLTPEMGRRDLALIVGAFVAKLRLEKGEAAVARWLEQM
jgi:hypothetical protein